MRAIKTQYVVADHERGEGIQATCGGLVGYKTIHWPYSDALDYYSNHRSACEALMREMGWTDDTVGGWYDGAFFWVSANSAFPRTNVNSNSK